MNLNEIIEEIKEQLVSLETENEISFNATSLDLDPLSLLNEKIFFSFLLKVFVMFLIIIESIFSLKAPQRFYSQICEKQSNQ